MAVSSGPPPTAPRPQPTAVSWFPFRIPNLGDHLFQALCLSAGVLVVVLFVALVILLIVKSWLTLSELGLDFFTSTAWNPAPGSEDYGTLVFIYGTVVTSAIAMLIAVPLGVGTAAFLSEIAPGWLRRVVSFLVEMLAAIPSVVYGFWGLFVMVPWLQKDLIPWLGGPDSGGGTGILPASLILAIMIVPYVTAVSYDVCRAVPKSQREAALALGATRWQTIWLAVLPYARPGILGASFLALGRAIGETMAVTMLIGNQQKIEWSAFARGDSIASILANEYRNASSDKMLSALTELALVLLLVSILTNSLARLLIWRVSTPRSVSRAAAGQESLPRRVVAAARRAFTWLAFPLAFGYLLDALLTGILRDPHYLHLGPIYDLGRAAILVNTVVLAALARLGLWASGRLLKLVSPAASGVARAVNALMSGVLGLCGLLTVVPLFFILGYLLVEGFSALSLDFFTKLPVPMGEPGGGLANALVGSAILVGLASAFAIPVGLFSAIYLAENRKSRLGSLVRFVGELLGGVPSIVIGIYAYSILLKPMGVKGAAGAFALGVMMIPIVMRAAEESLKLVPESIRQASYALGANQWQTVMRVIVPAALPAIITGIFLAIARIGGETAPLLLTAGTSADYPSSLADNIPSLPVFIYDYSRGNNSAIDLPKAWAAALVLLVVIVLLNFGIRFLTGKRIVQASRAD